MAEQRDDEREDQEESPGPGRPIWSGTLSFGLVSVPVNLLPAVRSGSSGGVSLRMLDSDGTPLSRRYICPAEDVEVPNEHLMRGYEVEPGEFVIVRDEELEALEPRKSRDIDLRQFVKRDAIPPIYFERSYYLGPSTESTKAYHLLAQTMEKTGRIGIATFVMREKEYLVAIVAEAGVLRAQIMRFPDELRTPQDVGLPPREAADPQKVAQFEKAIAALNADELDMSELVDEQTRRLVELVTQKEAHGEDIVEVEEVQEGGETPVKDLMAALQRSLAAAGQAAGPAPLPIANYDELTADKIKQQLAHLDAGEVEQLRSHEASHKERKTVLEAMDRRAAELGRRAA